MKLHFRFDRSEAAAHLRDSDRTMAELIDRIGPFTLKLAETKSLFEALLRSIVYQQLHGKAAQSIHGRVLAEMAKKGGPLPSAVAVIDDATYRAAGLSRSKLFSIRDLAAKCLDGTVPSLSVARRLSDVELERRLTIVRGIGPWTVHMVQIFYLGQPDVMPTGDFAIRQAFKKLYRKRVEPSPETILRYARRWQPYRSVASWYLWRSLDPA